MSDIGVQRLSVAPMMDYTDRHCRYFLRLLTRHTWLYTEMVTAQALIYGDAERLLGCSPREQPVVLQLGGADPKALSQAARLGAAWGYREINLNVGCPSPRVQKGQFGACLLLQPDLVARCVQAMGEATGLPITVKTRIGVDHQDSYEVLYAFVERLQQAGCQTFIIHARKAWLTGLSPKQNREVPPLRYDVVYRLKRDFPGLTIIINGGVLSHQAVSEHLQFVDGVMIGRWAYHEPYCLAQADRLFFDKSDEVSSRLNVVLRLLPYMLRQCAHGVRLSQMTRPILGLFNGQPGARSWRRYLSEHAPKPGATISTVEKALQFVS